MYVRICRYRVLPQLMERYMSIQRRAGAVCQAQGIGAATYFQSAHDPCEWMEVYRYTSQAACRVTTGTLAQQPEIMALWQEFQEVLDPGFSVIVEEFHERNWFSEPEEEELVLEDESDLVPGDSE